MTSRRNLYTAPPVSYIHPPLGNLSIKTPDPLASELTPKNQKNKKLGFRNHFLESPIFFTLPISVYDLPSRQKVDPTLCYIFFFNLPQSNTQPTVSPPTHSNLTWPSCQLNQTLPHPLHTAICMLREIECRGNDAQWTRIVKEGKKRKEKRKKKERRKIFWCRCRWKLYICMLLYDSSQHANKATMYIHPSI